MIACGGYGHILKFGTLS